MAWITYVSEHDQSATYRNDAEGKVIMNPSPREYVLIVGGKQVGSFATLEAAKAA